MLTYSNYESYICLRNHINIDYYAIEKNYRPFYPGNYRSSRRTGAVGLYVPDTDRHAVGLRDAHAGAAADDDAVDHYQHA